MVLYLNISINNIPDGKKNSAIQIADTILI